MLSTIRPDFPTGGYHASLWQHLARRELGCRGRQLLKADRRTLNVSSGYPTLYPNQSEKLTILTIL